MSTLPNQKMLSFRVSKDLWIRLGVAARQRQISVQALCTQAIEDFLKVCKKNGDINGKPVRSALADLKKSVAPKTENE